MGWFGFKVVLDMFETLLKEMTKDLYHSFKNESDRALLISLISAITETRSFIETKGYTRGSKIQRLWFDVSEKARASNLYRNQKIPDWLFTKGEFWGSPEKWIEEQASLELVPTLKELEKEVERIKGFLGH